MDGTYIRLDRSLLRHRYFSNPKLLKVWLWCLLRANYTERTALVGRQKVELKPGQFITGRHAAATELQMSPSSAWRSILLLKADSKVDIKTNNKFSVITVIDFETYQIDNKKVNSKVNSKLDKKWTANGQQMDTDNKDNKKPKTLTCEDDELFMTFFNAYPRQEDPNKAWREWKKLKSREEVLAKILDALEWQTRSDDWVKDGGQYIPKPHNYLANGGWRNKPKQQLELLAC